MKKFISRQFIGVLALLFSSAGMAASIIVTPSTANPIEGDPFSVTVSGVDFPSTAGATLRLSWNPTVNVTSIVLAAGSPFTGGIVAGPFPTTSPTLVTVLGPLVGTLPSGNFDAFTINFDALTPGDAGIVLFDDGADLCWTDAVTFGCVTPANYTQASVNVNPVPAPAAAWLIAPAMLAAGRFSRRRKAA